MSKIQTQKFLCSVRFLFALLAGLAFISNAGGQQQRETQHYDNRVLLVFDTSWAMKARIPKTQSAITQLLARLATVSELRTGDTIGVWTFSDEVTTGKFPLQVWNSSFASTTISNIVRFVKEQKFSGNTHFEKLMPMLSGLVEDSDRLTIVIFCDGDGKISGTRWDDAINGLFSQRHTFARHNGEPIVLIFRSQLGRYVGCGGTVAPEIDVPYFPPFPAPPKPLFTPPKTNAVNTAPVQTAPPLLIVGTNVYTGNSALTNGLEPRPAKANVPAEKTNALAPLLTNTVTITNVVTITNSPTGTIPLNSSRTNAESVTGTNSNTLNETNFSANAASMTNSIPATNENSGNNGIYAVVGAGFLIAAIVVAGSVRRSRKSDSASLITRSMNKK